MLFGCYANDFAVFSVILNNHGISCIYRLFLYFGAFSYAPKKNNLLLTDALKYRFFKGFGCYLGATKKEMLYHYSTSFL